MFRVGPLLLLLLLAAALLPVGAAPDEVRGCLLAAVDAGAAVMAGRLRAPAPSMPGVEARPLDGLPEKAVFDKADLGAMVEALRPEAPARAPAFPPPGAPLRPGKPVGGLWAALCWRSLSSRNRERGQHVFSGTMEFGYTEGLASVNDILTRTFSGKLGDEKVFAVIDLTITGDAVGREIRLGGRLELGMPAPGTVEVRLEKGFVLDGMKSGGGTIRYTLDPFAWRSI